MTKAKTPGKATGGGIAQTAPLPEARGVAPASRTAATDQYPRPQVRHATANTTLPPMSSTEGTAVIIPAAIATGVQIQVFWAILGQEDDPVFTANAQGTGRPGVEVQIPATVIGPCIGKTLSIWYATATDRSLSLELTVEVIDPQDMPAAQFLDLVTIESSQWLDMKRFPGDARLKLCGLPFIAEGQRVWIEAVGNEHQPIRRFYWVLNNHRVTAQEAQQGACFLLHISREWLAGNEDWSSITIHAGITFDGAPGTAPENPSIANIPANAHELQRATAKLRLGEPALQLLAPTVREATYAEGQGYLINPTNTVHGAHVIVKYEGMKAGHRVCVDFRGTAGAGSPQLECQDVQQDGTPLVFFVPPTAISANFGEPVAVTYTVSHDDIGPWRSPTFSAEVLALTGLPSPQVQEATGSVLDLNTFNGDATCTVEPWSYIALGECCWMWIAGAHEDGSPFRYDVLIGQPIEAKWLVDGVSVALARDRLQQLADCGQFELHVAVAFDGNCEFATASKFPVLTLTIAQPALVLDKPQVLQAVRDYLTVWNGRDGVKVRVQYGAINARDKIAVCWKQNGICLPQSVKPGNSEPGYVDFDIPREAVIHGINKTIPIDFTVRRACQQPVSAQLDLIISEPVKLSLPEIVEATSWVLDMRNFAGDAHIRVPAWWFILKLQKAWLECWGTGEDGRPYIINVMIAQDIEEDDLKGLYRPLAREELLRFKNNTFLTVKLKVTADGDSNVSRAIPFPPARALLFTKKLLDVTRFIGDNRNGWEKGAGVTDDRDLSIKIDPDGRRYLFDYGYSNTTDPLTQSEKLFKHYTELEAGRTYEFRVDVRRGSGGHPAPIIALTVVLDGNVKDVYGPELVLSRTWITIKGTFTATSSNARLGIQNRQMGIAGNDIDFSEIVLEEL